MKAQGIRILTISYVVVAIYWTPVGSLRRIHWLLRREGLEVKRKYLCRLDREKRPSFAIAAAANGVVFRVTLGHGQAVNTLDRTTRAHKVLATDQRPQYVTVTTIVSA